MRVRLPQKDNLNDCKRKIKRLISPHRIVIGSVTYLAEQKVSRSLQLKLAKLPGAEAEPGYLDTLLKWLGVSEEPGWPNAFGKALRLRTKALEFPLKTISLFTGGGGLDIGFDDACFENVEMVEIDETFVETLEANKNKGTYFRNSKILCKDIGDYEPPSASKIDLVIGGPPCQSFSAAGRRAAGAPGLLDARGELYKQFIGVIESVRPTAFLFENVYGLTGVQNGDTWKAVLSDFAELGYTVTHRILDAADYGVPQHRERLIVIGVQGTQFLFPKPTHGPDSPDQHHYYVAEEALLDLCEEEKPRPVGGRWGHLLKDVPPGLNYSFYTSRMGHPRPIFAWRSKFSDFLYKADPKEPIRTLKATGGLYTGPFHWENRPFSVAELKRLHTIPDEYIIVGNKQTAIIQIGNSVPPQLARMLALCLLKQVWKVQIPADIKLLGLDEKLTFRNRKRELTRIYQNKATKAIELLKNSADEAVETSVANFSQTYYARLDMNEFGWKVDSARDRELLVDVRSSDGLLSIQIHSNDADLESTGSLSGCVITVLPSRIGWDIPFRGVRLLGTPLTSNVFTGLWKAFEYFLVESNLKADLVQLCGYYQYMPRIQAQMVIEEGRTWEFVKKVVEGVAIRRILPLRTLSKLLNVSPEQARDGLMRLRKLGYEVRGNSTNLNIPRGHYLIPYSFPTLNPNSVQVRKHLEVDLD